MASSSEHFHCPFDGCSRHYTRYHDLKRHWVKLHNQSLEQLTELQPRNQKPFVCTECGHTFTRNDSLKVHQSKFHGSRETKEGRFKCPYVEECDQKTAPFWNVHGLIKHCQEVHNDQFGELKIQCISSSVAYQKYLLSINLLHVCL